MARLKATARRKAPDAKLRQENVGGGQVSDFDYFVTFLFHDETLLLLYQTYVLSPIYNLNFR